MSDDVGTQEGWGQEPEPDRNLRALGAEELPNDGHPPNIAAQFEEFINRKTGKVVMRIFKPAILGGWLKRHHYLLFGVDRQIYRYRHGVYRPADDWVREQVRENHGQYAKPRHADEVVNWLQAEEPVITDATPEHLINVTSGLLEWRTGTLHSHSPEVITTTQLPVGWDPTALCPAVDRFLADVMPRDAVDFAWEILGYAIYGRRPFHKALMQLGPQGTGKSKYQDLMKGLLGGGSYTTATLQSLAENRFTVANLFGKNANICGDLDARAVTRSDIFKQVVGGDEVQAERKFKDAFVFQPRALLVFSTNEAPMSSDQTDAFFVRWIVLPMTQVFRGTDKEDPDMREKLLAELDGVLVKAVAGLRRLMERGRFDEPRSVREAWEAYRQQLDSVEGFVHEMCVVLEGANADKADLHRAYRRWCLDSGRQPVSAQKFNQRLPGVAGGVYLGAANGRPTWRGIGLSAVRTTRAGNTSPESLSAYSGSPGARTS